MACDIRTQIKKGIENTIQEYLTKYEDVTVQDNMYSIPDKRIITSLNEMFGVSVLEEDNGKYHYNIPKILIEKYLYSRPEGKEEMLKALRENYLSMMNSKSLNLMQEDLWINHPILSNPTIKQLLSFLKKVNKDFRVEMVDELPEKAITLIADRIIMVKNGYILSDLPEEVAHIFIELLPENSDLRKRMVDRVVDLPIYKKVYEQYSSNPLYQKNGKPDIDKLKREAAAKLLAEYVNDTVTKKDSELDEKYGKKRSFLKQLFHDLINFLRNAFNKITPRQYRDNTRDLSVFRTAADKLLMGDLKDLNVDYVPTIYDSIFLSALADEMEKEPSDLVKQMRTFAYVTRRKLRDLLKKFASDNKLEALSSLLLDEQDLNKIEAVISILASTEDTIKSFLDDPEGMANSFLTLSAVSHKMAEAMAELEAIPRAIEKVTERMEAGKDLSTMIDNINELQSYITFSKNVKDISSKFNDLIVTLKQQSPDNQGVAELYEKIVNKSGNTVRRFELADNLITRKIQKHLLDLTYSITEETFKKQVEEADTLYKKFTVDRHKKNLLKRLRKTFIGKDMNEVKHKLALALTGDISSPIKDIHNMDYLVYFAGPLTKVNDPYVSSAVKLLIEKIQENQTRSFREGKLFADSIIPTLKELSDNGLDYYEAQALIQDVEKFFDSKEENQYVEKRTLLDQMKRHDFFFEKQQLLYKIRQSKDAEREEAIQEYSKFLSDYSHRKYNDEFYKVREELEKYEGTSDLGKRIKRIKVEILNHKSQLNIAINNATGTSSDIAEVDYIAVQIANLTSQLYELRLQLPEEQEEKYKLYEQLYEVDEQRTEQNYLRHRYLWVNDFVRVNPSVSREEAGRMHDVLFNTRKPTKEFWDKFGALIDELKALSAGKLDILAMVEEEEKLRKEERKIRTLLRDVPGRALIHVKDVDGGMMVEKLAFIDERISELSRRIKIFSTIYQKPQLDKKIKEQAKFFADAIYAVDQLFLKQEKARDTAVKVFNEYFSFTTSNADQLVDALIDISINGPKNKKLYEDSVKGMEAKDPVLSQIKTVFFPPTLEKFSETFSDMNEKFSEFYSLLSRSEVDRNQVDDIYARMNELYTKTVSNEYYRGPFQIFMEYAKEYVSKFKQSELDNNSLKLLYFNKVKNYHTALDGNVSSVEEFFADGMFDSVMTYINYLSETGESTYDDYIYLQSTHKKRVVYNYGWQEMFYSPAKFLQLINPIDPSDAIEEKDPIFRVSKIKDEFLTKTADDQGVPYNDLHPLVIEGKMAPIIDLNGEFLPKVNNGKFRNEKYDKLATSTDKKDKLLFKLLQDMKTAYLKKQVTSLEEGRRLGLVIPARAIQSDKYENVKLKVSSIQEWKNNIQNYIPFFKRDEVNESEELKTFEEEMGTRGIINRDFYTGEAFTNGVKLRSRRGIPLRKTSKDVLSSILMFHEDVGEYSAKSVMEGVFKSFANQFFRVQSETGFSKNRSKIFNDLLDIRIHDVPPDNFGNNPIVGRILQTINRLSVFKLMADPLGAMVNLASGTQQTLIENAISTAQFQVYLESSAKAAKIVAAMDRDNFRKNNLGIETQFVEMLKMLPDGKLLSNQMSLASRFVDVQSILLAPRSETEKYMGVQLGLSVVNVEKIHVDKKNLELFDLYELGKDNLIKLKDEYNTEEMRKLYDPVDGTHIKKMRNKIFQTYTLLQGNFFDFNQSYLSSMVIGKSVELMKRWFVPGILRRWGNPELDFYTEEEYIPYHTAMFNLIKEFAIGAWKGEFGDYWDNVVRSNPKMENALKRSLAEIALIMFWSTMLAVVLGYDDDDDDRNKKLKEMDLVKLWAILIAMRVEGELGTFIPLPVAGLGFMEMKRAIIDPLSIPRSTVDNLAGFAALSFFHVGDALGVDMEDKLYYKKDTGYRFKNKGDSKWVAFMLNSLGYTGFTLDPEPYIRTINQQQNRLK